MAASPCCAYAGILLLRTEPRRRHAIRHGDEERLGVPDRAVLNLEHFEIAKGMRRFERRIVHNAVGGREFVEVPRMVDEAAGEHQALFFVNQREAAGAQFVVPAVVAELESGLAGKSSIGGKIQVRVGIRTRMRIVGGPDAVLTAAAVGSELGKELAVVELERVEVAVGEGDQAL